MIICLGATPALQRVMLFDKLLLDAVNRAVTTHDGIAGKSVNVAKVLRALGSPVTALGFAGDRTGELLVSELQRRGINTAFVPVEQSTRQCTTVIDIQAGTHTELVEESKALPASKYTDLLGLLHDHLHGARALVLSGTATPGAPPDFYARSISLAKSHNVPSIVDAKGDLLRLALQQAPTLAKPNLSELGATVGRCLKTEAEVVEAVGHVGGAHQFVVTAGQNPAIAFDGSRFWRIHPSPVKVQNPIGSGDAFTAALALKLAEGADLGEACRWGAAAGAANALTLMPGELDPQDVQRLLDKVTVEPLPA